MPKGQLTPAMFQILLSLGDGERHGYGIMRDIADRTDGEMRVGAATLYRCIKRMLEAGLIVETDERPDPRLDDERRRYYRLSELGERLARDEAARLVKLLQSACGKRFLDIPGLAPLGGKA